MEEHCHCWWTSLYAKHGLNVGVANLVDFEHALTSRVRGVSCGDSGEYKVIVLEVLDIELLLGLPKGYLRDKGGARDQCPEKPPGICVRGRKLCDFDLVGRQ